MFCVKPREKTFFRKRLYIFINIFSTTLRFGRKKNFLKINFFIEFKDFANAAISIRQISYFSLGNYLTHD